MEYNSGIRLVAFDLGGVLVAVEKTLDDAFFDAADFKALTTGALEPHLFFERISLRLGQSPLHLERAFKKMLTVKNGTRSILQQLAVPFTFWSNINVCHFEHLLSTNTFLRKYQTRPSGLSFQLSQMKPSSDFFKTCLHKSGLRPDQIFFLDDSTNNIMAAKRLGIVAQQVQGIKDTLDALYERELILMPKGLAPFE